MDVSTLAGIVVDCFIIVGIIINGTLQSFYDLASIMIVLGGTLAATMVSYPFKRLVGFTVVVKSFSFHLKINHRYNRPDNRIANIARKEGLLALEEAALVPMIRFYKKNTLL